MNVVIIPAKGTSTRLKNKNVYEVLGKPLLWWTVEYAKANKLVHAIFVSTEDENIARLAKEYEVGVIERPLELCGEQPLLDVYTHAYYHLTTKHGYQINKIIGLQVDNPDREIYLDNELRFMDEQKYNLMFSISSDGWPNGAAKIYTKYILTCGRPYYLGVMIDDCTNIHYEDDIKIAEHKMKGLWWYNERNDR